MKYVLFVCNQNAGRSQMAEAFFAKHAPADIRAESAGDHPAKAVHAEVVEVMKEVGVDLSERRPRKLTVEMQLHADWAITLACGAQCPYVPTKVEDWDLDDPAGQPLDEVRRIRDDIEARVQELLAERIDAIRSDRTAHQLRLVRLIPPLVEEFGGSVSPDEIRAVADEILSDYDHVPVRSFVSSIVNKRARATLKERTATAPAAG
jgi:arsenate reductase